MVKKELSPWLPELIFKTPKNPDLEMKCDF